MHFEPETIVSDTDLLISEAELVVSGPETTGAGRQTAVSGRDLVGFDTESRNGRNPMPDREAAVALSKRAPAIPGEGRVLSHGEDVFAEPKTESGRGNVHR